MPPDPMLGWLEHELAGPSFDRDFLKLARSGRPERHLVLRMDVGAAIPAGHWLAMTDATVSLPSRPPAPVGRALSGLWLIADFSRWWVYSTADSQWSRVLIEGDGR